MGERTPKNYCGTQSPSKQLRDLLPLVVRDLKAQALEPKEEIFAYWRELVGEKMAPLAEPITWIEGVLTVKVKSSTLYSLLVCHERPRLFKKLQEKFAIRNLQFRVG